MARPPNIGLNGGGLDPTSDLKPLLCLVTTKIYLLAAAPTAAYNTFYFKNPNSYTTGIILSASLLNISEK